MPRNPDRAKPQPLISFQMPACVFNQNSIGNPNVGSPHGASQHSGIGLGSPCTVHLHVFNRDHALKQPFDAQFG